MNMNYESIYLGKRLVIIGASHFPFPFVKRAKELGIETHTFAWEEGAVAKSYCDHFYPISIVEKQALLTQERTTKPGAWY